MALGSPIATGAWLAGGERAGAASIKGRVQVVGGAVAQKQLPVTVDQYLCDREKDTEDLVVSPHGAVRNAVVWLTSPPPGAKWEAVPGPNDRDRKTAEIGKGESPAGRR